MTCPAARVRPTPPQQATAASPATAHHGSQPAPCQESPAARLLRAGGKNLSDAEVVAVLIGGDRAGDRSLTLARDLLAEWGGLSALFASRALLRRSGLADAQRAALLAAYEMACRIARQSIPLRRPLAQPGEVARYLTLQYQQRDQEVMGALFLDVRRNLISDKEIFRGTLHRAAVEPREILKECLLRGAAGVALFHTHPSGDPTPSDEDLRFTRRMEAAAELVGVELLDHLVLGANGFWVSLRNSRYW
jgi:DNA repair protein RadC